MADLLIELFSEEIPARMQARAGADLKRLVTDGLAEAGLRCSGARAFVTPRRLALHVEGLPGKSPLRREERRGPRADAPQKAIEGFLRATGMRRAQLETRATAKGDVLFAVIEHAGRPAGEIVAEVLECTVRNFPWPRSMRWGGGTLKWVRPLHSILCLLSDEAGARVVALDIDGIKAGDSTAGHRFMAPGRFSVTGFQDYATRLKRAFVRLDAAERAEAIRHDATTAAFAQGLELVEDAALLAEVAGLVEWPVVLMGEIESDFLGLPPEVLQTSMREHQKFFSVKDPKSGQIVRFVTVANRETADDGAAILAGNRKVLAARLADARFFWENDLRVARAGMASWLDALAHVTFHNRLGSQKERVARLERLAGELAPATGADAALAREAARVAKADLASEMVYEFPELQGTMGRCYATAAGLRAEVAAACEEHYAPLGPSDAVPRAPVSVAVGLADKIDMLAGFWAIGEKPTGSKDPFALRRAALGVIRLVLDNDLRLPLLEAFRAALNGLDEQAAGKAAAGKRAGETDACKADTGEKPDGKAVPRQDPGDDLLAFFHDRLKVHLRDRGIRHDVIDACLSMPGNDDLSLLVRRARALSDFLETEDGANLLQGFRRANNILEQAEARDGVEYSYGAEEKFLRAPQEKALFRALSQEGGAISSAIDAEDFASAMASLASLRVAIDGFFEAVQVNDENDVIRRNRLNMLSSIRDLCLGVADLRRIEG